MEPTTFELTPAQKNILLTLSRATGKSVPVLLDEALEGLCQRKGIPTPKPPKRKRVWEVAAELLADVPPEAFEHLPVDGAAQHDHYIYGTPKRTP